MTLSNARHLFASPSRRAILASAISLISVFPAAGTALAQETPRAETAKAEAAADENSSEIIVTARRREEKIQDVPIAITAISQQELDNNNVKTLSGLFQAVPSMAASSGTASESMRIEIRGQAESNGRPGVVMYLNDIPLPEDVDGGTAGGPGLLFDLENVQILKGPQGTLFGFNTIGGAVLLQTTKPKNEFGGHLQFGVGNYNNMELDGAINLPVVPDKLLARLAFNGQKRDGFTRFQSTGNHLNGIDADNRDFWSVRGSVTFKPISRFQNDLTVTYQRYRNNGTSHFLTNVNPSGLAATVFPSLPGLLAQQQLLGHRVHLPVDTPLGSESRFLAISNVSKIDLTDSITVRGIFGFTHLITSRTLETDGTILPLADTIFIPRHSEKRQFIGELQIVGRSFDNKLDWIIGGFGMEQPRGDLTFLSMKFLGSPVESLGRTHIRSRAMYGQATYDLSNWLSGLEFYAGLRKTWDHQDGEGRGGGGGSVCRPVPNAGCSTASFSSYSSDALTWSIGLNYKLAPSALIYLTSRRGYRPGGNNNLGALGIVQYKPEYVMDYELGVKADWRVGLIPVRTNVDVYYQDYTDIQVSRAVDINGFPRAIIDNAAKGRIWGVELETTIRPTHNLEIGAHLSYLDIKFTKFATGVSPATIASLKLRETLSPDFKYGLHARYHLPVPETTGDLSVQANWNWQAKSGNLARGLGANVPAYGLLSLSVNWDKVGGQPLDVSLYMSNALNKTYNIGGLGVFGFLGFATTMYGEPRMFGARLKYRFGGEDHR